VSRLEKSRITQTGESHEERGKQEAQSSSSVRGSLLLVEAMPFSVFGSDLFACGRAELTPPRQRPTKLSEIVWADSK
jgi:hypothetical protein